MMKIFISFFVSLVVVLSTASAQTAPKTFTNPLLPSGADPWVIQHNGYYYYTNSTQNNLVIWKTKDMSALASAEKKVIWVPPANTMHSRELWAPELHYINHKWYMYFAADDGDNNHHRLYVLENSAQDPLKGEWIFKGKVADASNKWAIDGSVFTNKGKLYMIWAGWEGDTNGQQNIYIAKLINPWTVDGKRVKLSSPDYEWEKHGDLNDTNLPHVNVNEGPELLKHNGKLFLIYSASGCWTDFYALGMLSADANADLLDPASWKKSSEPVFKQSPENSVYAPGHNSFFRSPDGTEDWILYHANDKPGLGCGKYRSPRMQKFTWNKDGTPYFGVPVKANEPLPVPSGTR
ncbi:glycoside hydrolase family 43 protein [Mucilaginibacter segetis]|uniref:Glycoside hydrolase family 43 protein n=1 Tax=Mucilaginibacter segetis TaxID=2793071 RepID=A0A934PS09_9SPHI|nr:glycoside hydrolase family 43 protein [Mucilaginibacter segetis]MBK0379034.1 glycoside hydrolase family 43 protein [Mucilaginibacter segetis]